MYEKYIVHSLLNEYSSYVGISLTLLSILAKIYTIGSLFKLPSLDANPWEQFTKIMTQK